VASAAFCLAAGAAAVLARGAFEAAKATVTASSSSATAVAAKTFALREPMLNLSK
jgi:hypothetical protein